MTQPTLDLPTTPHATEGPDNDGFFIPLGNTRPYAKIALEGFAASGKTYTMVEMAIGIHKLIKSKKPVAYLDSETAAVYAGPRFAKAGIDVKLRPSKSPADLIETMRRCRNGLADILIADSMTHFWQSFVNSYKAERRKERLSMDDWGTIKDRWRSEIMEPFVRDHYHFLFTGRAGYEYDSEINEETEKREIFKTGVKMKMEGETAFEPDIVVLMERVEEMGKPTRGKKGALRVYRRATILKDRASLIDGQTFENPNVELFLPSIEFVIANPITNRPTPEMDTGVLFASDGERKEWLRRRDIATEKIEGELVAMWPGQAADAKKSKMEALERAFGTKSWTQITGMRPDNLEAGLAKLTEIIASAKAAERVECDMAAVWPGEGQADKAARKAALYAAYEVTSMAEVREMAVADIEAGFERLRAHVAERQDQAAKGEAPADAKPKGKASKMAKLEPVAEVPPEVPTTEAPPAAQPEFVMSTLAARKELLELAKKARVDNYIAWFNVKAVEELSAAQVAEAKRRLNTIIASEAAA
jgi:hypothetical protein